VQYQPGSIKVIGYDDQGKMLAEKEIKTAGRSSKIELAYDRGSIHADGEDLSFVTVQVSDADGNVCPTADNLIEFEIEGQGEIVAVGNGNPISHESYQASQRKLFNGLCLVIVRSTNDEGSIKLTATSNGLKEQSVTIKTSKGGNH
jgi:beta-galactosidase